MPQFIRGDCVHTNDSSIFFEKADGTLLEFIRMNASDELRLISDLVLESDLVAGTDGTSSLGTTSVRWLKAWLDGLAVTDDADIGGDLTVTGAIQGASLSFDGSNLLETFVDATAATPVPTGAAGDITTETSTGRWCRIGPVVHLVLKVAITDVGTATGDLTITLPAAVPTAANISMDQPLALHTESVTEASVQLSAKIISNTRTIKFFDVKTNAAADVTDVENGTFEVSGSYLVE